MKNPMKKKNKQDIKELARRPRSKTPRTTDKEAQPQEDILDKSRYDISDERVEWKID